MRAQIIVAWVDVIKETGISNVTGFHTDLESVPEQDRPPYVIIDAIPTPTTSSGKFVYDWGKKVIIWEDIPSPPPTPSPEERIAKLEQENSDMKSCLNEIIMGGTA